MDPLNALLQPVELPLALALLLAAIAGERVVRLARNRGLPSGGGGRTNSPQTDAGDQGGENDHARN